MHALLAPRSTSLYRRLLALGVAVLLLAAQHGAFAHHLTHIVFGSTAQQQTIDQDDAALHMAAELQGHICTTCLALDAFDAALPTTAVAAHAAVFVAALTPAVPHSAPQFTPARYRARAPPSLT